MSRSAEGNHRVIERAARAPTRKGAPSFEPASPSERPEAGMNPQGSSQPPLADARARQRAEACIEESLVVRAGAGTGKTSVLVGRLTRLVAAMAERDTDEQVVAITFTEAAAEELRNRTRRALHHMQRPEVDERLEDLVVVSTIHAFARRLLQEHWRAAGLPPGFAIATEVQAIVGFRQEWRRFLATQLARAEPDGPHAVDGNGIPSLASLVAPLEALGVRVGSLEELARSLARRRELLDDRLRERLRATARTRLEVVRRLQVVSMALEEAAALAAHCEDPQDRLAKTLRNQFAPWAAKLRHAADTNDELQGIEALHDCVEELGRTSFARQGKREHWPPSCDVHTARSRAEDAVRTLREVHQEIVDVLAARLCVHLVDFVHHAAELRRTQGILEFHDLLLVARDLLREHPEILDAARRRYRYLLVDEFQDTDPLQVELVCMLAGIDRGCPNDRENDRLFVVGDARQSIYRFRGADHRAIYEAERLIGADRTVHLSVTHRSVPGIVRFVNAYEAFLRTRARPVLGGAEGAVRGDGEGAVRGDGEGLVSDRAKGSLRGDGEGLVPDRAEGAGPWGDEPLAAARAEDPPRGPAVGVLGLDDDRQRTERAAERRERAAAALARVLRRAVKAERWDVEDRVLDAAPRGTDPMPSDDDSGSSGARPSNAEDVRRWRPAGFGDVAVLLPRRTALEPLLRAFEHAGVPYRLVGTDLIWETPEVAELLQVLRAVDDPGDPIAVVGALRTTYLGCSDEALLRWRAAHPRSRGDGDDDDPDNAFDPRRFAAACGASKAAYDEHDPVCRGLALLAEWHHRRDEQDVSALIAEIVEVLHARAVALVHPWPADRWARLEWLVDQARRFDETEGSSLRDFLALAEQEQRFATTTDTAASYDDEPDCVSVMTIHGAKGLEFPIVALFGLDTARPQRRGPQVLVGENGLEVRFSTTVQTTGFDELAHEEDAEADSEEQRLLYVGLTRARDHLVIALHGATRGGRARAGSSNEAALAAESLARLLNDAAARNERLATLLDEPDDEHVRQVERADSTAAAATGAGHQTDLAGAAEGHPAVAHRAPAALHHEVEAWMKRRPRWQAERAALIGRLGRQLVLAPSDLEAEPARRPPVARPAAPTGLGAHANEAVAFEADRSLVDHAKRIGRAVHDVLRVVIERHPPVANARGSAAPTHAPHRRDVPPDELTEEASHSAARYGVPEEADRVATMVKRALAWLRGSLDGATRWFVELELGSLVADGAERSADAISQPPVFIEGRADLVIERGGALEIVDFKTDALVDDAARFKQQVERLRERYAPQLGAYALALSQATGLDVAACRLVLLGGPGGLEHPASVLELGRGEDLAGACHTIVEQRRQLGR